MPKSVEAGLSWFCAWCSNGPMGRFDDACYYCHRSNQGYSFTDNSKKKVKSGGGRIPTQTTPVKHTKKGTAENPESTESVSSKSALDSEHGSKSLVARIAWCSARDEQAPSEPKSFPWIKFGLPTIPDTFSLPPVIFQYQTGPSTIHDQAVTKAALLKPPSHLPLLQSPRAYFEKLSNLKIEVYGHSALTSLLKWNQAVRPLPDLKTFDQQILEPQISDWPRNLHGFYDCNQVKTSTISWMRHPESLVRELKTYQSILLAAFSNIRRMQAFGFVQNQISLLVSDKSRLSVADLIPIPINNIENLAKNFNSAVIFTDNSNFLPQDLGCIVLLLTKFCNEILQSVQLSSCPPYIDTSDYYDTEDECCLCLCNTVRLLDIAVLAYAGAHIDPILGQMCGFNMDEESSLGTVYSQFIPGIQLYRRPLKCLSPLLGDAQAWVFALPDHISDGELYVSTKAEVFADIWGPMWKVSHESDGSILHYNVGSGSIVPWDAKPGQHPRLKGNERMGHWMPGSRLSDHGANKEQNPWLASPISPINEQFGDSDSSESEPDDQVENSGVNTDTFGDWNTYAKTHPFSGNERLLIGARTSPKLVWNTCRCSTHKFTHRLRENQQLHFLETSGLFHYVDSRNISMVAGSRGFALGLNVNIKTQTGRSWKEVLLEVWENQPDRRNPQVFESFWGVEVSLCTRNARRVRLTELLGTDSIRNLLRPFGWSDNHIRDAFYSAVSSPNPSALGPLWRNKAWREELGNVLLTVLRALCQTGYDTKREEFYALWMSSKSTMPKKVVLKPSDHSWVRLLCDSEDSCAMAVVVKKCLGIVSDEEGLQICRTEGGWVASSRLETAIAVNHKVQSLLLEKKVCEQNSEAWRTADHQWKSSWDVSNFKQGDTFWMGPSRGRLKTVQNLSRSHLLLEWDRVKRERIFGIMGLNFWTHRDNHWEYTDVEDRPPVRPIPVHIQAGS